MLAETAFRPPSRAARHRVVSARPEPMIEMFAFAAVDRTPHPASLLDPESSVENGVRQGTRDPQVIGWRILAQTFASVFCQASGVAMVTGCNPNHHGILPPSP